MILPIAINLKNWANSLIVDFPNDNIPILTQEENWKQWGDRLVQSRSFINNNAPSTGLYDDWQSWANHVFFVMNNSNADEVSNV